MDIDNETVVTALPLNKEALDLIFLARQPILDQQKRLVAYELLFRSFGAEHACVVDQMKATTTVIQNTFIGMGFASVLGDKQGYINVDTDFLLSDLIEALPAKQVVLEILESVEPTSPVIERLKELKQKGYIFALDDYIGNSAKTIPLLNEVHIVKVDILAISPEILKDTVDALHAKNVKLVAEKVETQEQFELAFKLGFDFFQGYHFARPQLLTKKQQKAPAKMHLMHLLSLILSDTDIVTLSAEFKHHPALSYNLIRIVNSAASGLREQVASLQHAIMLLGRRQLQIWMQLLLYTTGSSAATKNPLLEIAASRGKFMELLAKSDPDSTRDDQDTAFMTGILSLMDALLEIPRKDILDEILVTDQVKDALLYGQGKLGCLLKITEKFESYDSTGVDQLLAGLPGVSIENVLQMQMDAFLWASNFDKAGEA